MALVREPAPDLPDLYTERDWHPQTLEWWSTWTESVLSQDFTKADWSYLMDTALLHNRLWYGDTSAAPELRLRVAKFGATPEDRARLRIVFADADAKEKSKTPSAGQGARERYKRPAG